MGSIFSETFHTINWCGSVLQLILEFLTQGLRVLALEPDSVHKISPLLLVSYVILGELLNFLELRIIMVSTSLGWFED